ncbi:MAG: cytochrome c maturation protein CcmE [bacterium]
MDPSRKRKIRLVVSLSVAVLLAAGLVYTSFSASTEAREPSEIIGSTSGSTYELTGKVVNDTVVRRGEDLRFRIRDREGT